jgi:nitroreductase
MELFEALYTTRAMRRVTDEPIPEEVQRQILDAAIRAPSGGNAQNWRFLLVDDPEVRSRLAPLYRECRDLLWAGYYRPRVEAAEADPDAAESIEFMKVKRSADWLADHFEVYPLLLFAFCQHDPTGGSIYPAVWSAQLAARAHGVGSSLTSMLMFKNAEVFEVLGVPAEEGWIMSACVTFGYPTGRWGVAPRQPAHMVSYRNHWAQPVGFEVEQPMWTGH